MGPHIPSLPPPTFVHATPLPVPFGRYEVNPKHIDEIQSAGLEFVGRDETGLRMEIAEIPRESERTGGSGGGGHIMHGRSPYPLEILNNSPYTNSK